MPTAAEGMPRRSLENALHHGALGLTALLPWLLILGRAAADAGLSAAALLFLLRSAATGDWSWTARPWVRVAAAAWLYLLAASLFTEEPGAGFLRALPWARFWIFAAAVQHWVLADAGARRTALASLAAAVAFVAVNVLMQWSVGFDMLGRPPVQSDRFNGPFSSLVSGSYLAIFGIPCLAALLGWAVTSRRPGRLALAVLAIALYAGLVVVVGSRMPMLLFALGLVLLVLAAPGIRGIMAAGVVAGAVVVLAVLAYDPSVTYRMVSFFWYQLSNFGESDWGKLFRSGLAVWTDHPWTGVGLRNFRIECQDEAYAYIGTIAQRCNLHPHNFYIEWLAEAGVLGLTAFLALLGALGREVARFRRQTGPARFVAAGAVVSLVMFVWPAASTSSFFSNFNAAFFWFVTGFALAWAAPGPLGAERRPARDAGAAQREGAATVS
ncbi:O-antigen ligase family protein [Arenibaculum pallidiluteum]|uniref:O-antigen ligase family protein n=1 Tax=Arenibaculum pallidiluteum TaxID=2812559 RepID=UPI001A967A2E|nr:O-antigen ligase family protein [Arenibaculum pallidiluteum]